VDIEQLRNEFKEISGRALQLKDSLIGQLNHLLEKNGVTLGVPIEGRVKKWASVQEKLDRKSLDISHIYELSDLVGIRIILLFKKDSKTVDETLKKHLNLLTVEDTGARLGETQFGYQSQHYIVKIPNAWSETPTFADLTNFQIEIQVRTLAQHIWAAASHKLQYKNESNVPLPVRRSIHRVSALLETVDLEFDRVLKEREEYLNKDISTDPDNNILNVDVLESVLSEIFPKKNKTSSEKYAKLLSELSHFGISNENSLRKLIIDNQKVLFDREEQQLQITREHDPKSPESIRGGYFSHTGLTRIALRNQFGNDIVLEVIKGRSEAP
jgi:putative GTP pyrophosphokinase